MVIPMWHEHQRDSEADVEAGTAARQQLAQTLDQLRRDMAAGTAAADAKVLLRVLFTQLLFPALIALITLVGPRQQLAQATQEQAELTTQLRDLVPAALGHHTSWPFSAYCFRGFWLISRLHDVFTFAQTAQSQREQAELIRQLQEMVRCLYVVVVLKPGPVIPVPLF